MSEDLTVDNQNEASESLNQDTVDALLKESSSQAYIVYKPEGGRYSEEEKVQVRDYDFRNPIFLSENELRQIRVRNERFIHYLSSRLSMFLRMDFGLMLADLSTQEYGKFTESIPDPANIALFSINQLTGIGIVHIRPRLAMTLVNRILGGKGHSIQNERPLTEIETILVNEAVEIILYEWVGQWKESDELDLVLIGNESSGRFLQTAPQDAIMLVFSMQATLGDCSETIDIAVPYYMIEPILKKMQAASNKYSDMGSKDKQARWMSSYSTIDIPIYVEWNAYDLTVRDLLHLRPGDVLELPQDIVHNTLLKLKDEPQFTGEVGVEHDCVAFKIRDKIKKETL